MRTKLLPHNKTAYQKVMRALETSDRTCVVHPTGTGKSYLIAAVSESYNKVLILGPNVFVLNQVHDVLKWRDSDKVTDTVEYMTYSLLMMKDAMPTGYDLICLDEFHRAGAPEWGDAVDRLLEANATAKVLGTTATPIRFLDDNRDMADELFHGNIASYMTLKDAWDRNILAMPRFVTGLFEFDRVADDVVERISKSRRIDDTEKKCRLTRLNNLRLEWERSQGMPQIIRKHIDPTARRIIVFCGNVEKLKDMEQTIRGWFQKAGVKVADVYMMHAYMPYKELSQAMTDFETDTDDGVKLMLSVNMLNEGVHISRVNAVILLRTTSSRIIYLQQIGRCLTAANTDKPVILDMVNNITTTNLVHDIKEGFDWYEHQHLRDDNDREPRQPKDFVVYDYTLGIQQAIDKLVLPSRTISTFEERLEAVTAFAERNNRLPGSKNDDHDIFLHWVTLKIRYGNTPEVKALKEKYDKYVGTDERIERLMLFVESNGRLPRKNEDYDEWMNYLTLCRRHSKQPDERMAQILDKYRHEETDEELLQRLVEFEEKNSRLPRNSTGTKYENALRRKVNSRLKSHPQVIALWKRYGKGQRVSFEDRMVQLLAFIDDHDRLPIRSEKEDYNNLSQLRRLSKDKRNDDLDDILSEYGISHKTDEDVKQMILDFYAEHGHLPRRNKGTKEESNLRMMLRRRKDTLYNDPDIAPLLAEARKGVPQEEKIRLMQEFTAKHGRRPAKGDDGKLWQHWMLMVMYDKGDPRVKELVEKYGPKETNLKEYMEPLVDFLRREHRRPSTTSTEYEKHLYSIIANLRKNYPDHPDVRPLLEDIDALPSAGEQKQARNDEWVRREIIAFTDLHHRMPKKRSGDNAEITLARLWASRRDRLCQDDPAMQAILDQYDNRPMKFEERYATVRDWAAEHDRLPRKADGGIFQTYETLRRCYYNVPEVQGLLRKYGARPAQPKIDIDARLNQIEAFAREHGRLPSTAHSDELQLARRWHNIKRRYGLLARVVALIERFPIQNIQP